MIVRILGEGQLDVDQAQVDHLNELDAAVEQAVATDDEAGFAQALGELLTAVRQHGTPLPDDSLVPSDAVVPSSDSALADVRELLGDEGLIPGRAP